MPSMPLSVIIVDDNRAVLSAVGLIIDQQADMELLGVASGVDERVALVRSWKPDVVVLDVDLPEGGGVRAAREMAVAAPAARLVAFSAFDKMLIRRTMTAVGVAASVSKAGDIRELRDAIRAGVMPPP
jgi:DNA-binding NarL/FixJ family response regulator